MENNFIKDLGMLVEKNGKTKRRFFLAKCSNCFNDYKTNASNWKKRKTNRCNICAKKEQNKTHGFTNTKLYKRWTMMRERCSENYKQSGYHGTYIVEEWNDFLVFQSWSLLNGYDEKLELDKDILCNQKNIFPKYYGPDTCKWITKKENLKNAKNHMRDKFFNEEQSGIKIILLKNGNKSYKLTHRGKYLKVFKSMNEAIDFKKKYIITLKT